MEIIFLVFTLVMGLALGSFMSVIVSRLDQKEGIVNGRSECPKCSHILQWHDLIPLVSFLILKGKCRYCKEKISPAYPAMELSVAFALTAYYAVNGFIFSWEGIYYNAVIFLLLALIYFDYFYLILPDKIIFTGLGMSLAYILFFRSGLIWWNILTGFGLAAFFGIIFIVSRGEWMGFGDVKLAFWIGLILGFPAGILSVIAAVWLGALFGLGMMAVSRATLKTALPFGSFMGFAVIIFIIFNEYINLIFKYI